MNLKVGNLPTTVVSETPFRGGFKGYDDLEYYGGYLVAESVPVDLALLLSFAFRAAEVVEFLAQANGEVTSLSEKAVVLDSVMRASNALWNFAGLRDALEQARSTVGFDVVEGGQDGEAS